jgi:hypothetical protein
MMGCFGSELCIIAQTQVLKSAKSRSLEPNIT